MIKLICKQCNNEFFTYPCRLKGNHGHTGKYCSKSCANKANWLKTGAKTCYQKGHKQSEKEIEKRIQATTGNNNKLWKGNKVGYRGIHYWVIRQKGIAQKCIRCGSTRNVQWANINHKYVRNIDDFISLCASCHKRHDISLKS